VDVRFNWKVLGELGKKTTGLREKEGCFVEEVRYEGRRRSNIYYSEAIVCDSTVWANGELRVT